MDELLRPLPPDLARVLAELHRRDREERASGRAREERLRAVPPEEGAWLRFWALTLRARRIVEVGTGHGVSTLWLASAALETDGEVIGLERDPRRAAAARENVRRAGVEAQVQIWVGPALELLPRIDGPVDLLFLDAEKEAYVDHLEAALPKLRPGALILAHNALSHREVLAAYERRVRQDPRMETLLVPVGRGHWVTRFRGG